MKHIILLILFAGIAPFIFGQSIEAVVSKTNVAAHERFTYEIVSNSSECKISNPDFGGLEVVAGPSQSQFSSTQIINGQMTQSTEYRWTYQLRAKKEGTYTISPVVMKCEDGSMETDGITIRVKEGQVNQDKDFFLRLTSNKSNVYEGEPFIVTLKYYAKVRPESIESLDLGDAVGIHRQDLKPDRQTFQTNVENVNGVRYYVIELRQEICFAQRSGKVTLEPYYAALVFSQGFFNRFRRETYSNSLDINVKKVPGSDNPEFNGLVGDFSVASEISSNHVQMGDAVDIKITIDGKGNMQALGNVALDFPAEFDQFDPNVEDKTSVSSSGISGKIEYNFVIIPKHYGTYTIPGYSFKYFDLDKKQMKSLSTGDFEIVVDKRDGVDIEAPEVLPDQENEIHYIEATSDAFFTEDDFFFGSWTYMLLLLSPIGISFLLFTLKRKKENLSDDEKLKLQQKKAAKGAQLAFKAIRQELDNGENTKALKSLQSALNGFFMQKFNVGLSELSQRDLHQKLADRKVPTEDLDRFNKIWNAIETGQYAPIATENLVQTVNETENLIINLDKHL